MRHGGPGERLKGVGAAAALLAAFALSACSTVAGDVPLERTALTTEIETGVGVTSPMTGVVTTPDDHAIKGIDVSKFQGSVDWASVRASGVSFAYIKATEGGDRIDDRFAENWAGAKAAGVPRGAYHFYYFCRTGAEQAAWFIRNVPADPNALPVVLDMEWNHLSPSCKRRPPVEEVHREMSTFLRIIEKHYGKRPMIYSSVDFHRDRLVGAFPGYHFWLRSVAGHPSLKYHPSRAYSFWQHTATGRVSGVTGNVDQNVFMGDVASFKRFAAAGL
ncbi:glycoside hydrolase family 25 protein [Hansschlegelia zhihuaiae]|uniref:Glycosyl hydrolase family 25 n=1 Tax=Hansschlegelia zhihuaiae TaxID=405005 RepID=A0A4Q0MP88_9HYPH|nr:GH25 family lysozyme [Hansschlegelia zhihuaiae]RXF74949.1 glycosyl hydrolase family 25 [Hansschlegelia zhihuaiae]